MEESLRCDVFLFFFFLQYIGTIGSPINWRALSPNEALPCDFAFRFPADLRHAVSLTTLKVLEGGSVPALLTRNANPLQMKDKELPEDADDTESSDATKPFARFLRKPSVKKDAQLEAQRRYEKPTLDISLPHVCLLSLSATLKLITVKIISHFSIFVSDPRLRPSENPPYSPNQPSKNHPEMLGDRQSSKFAVHLSRAGWIENGIKENFLKERSEF